jgi:uncharacterized protein YbcV (DUF1398 family)
LSKINVILFIIVVLFSGCAVFNKADRKNDNVKQDKEEFLKIVKENNITNKNFFIQKAKIQYNIKNEKHNLIVNIKFHKPDLYLASIRLISGIEILRIYYSKDTILINDRINKQILYGQDRDIERILGFSGSLLSSILLGDIYTNYFKEKDEIYWKNDNLIIENSSQRKKVQTVIDYKFRKPVSATIFTGEQDEEINFEFSRFKKGGIIMPQRIKIDDLKREAELMIKIKKFISPWEGKIEFIRGKGYVEKPIK